MPAEALLDRAWGKAGMEITVQGLMAAAQINLSGGDLPIGDRRELAPSVAFLLQAGAHDASREEGARG